MLTVFFSPSYFGILLPGLVNLVFMCIVLYILFRNRKDDEFIRTIKESFLTLVLVILIVNVTGSFLSKIGEVVGSRPEIYTAYPAIIDTVEDVGAIVGSTATTKLHLGTIKPSISSIKQHSTQIGASWTASLFMFTTYSIIASLIRGIFALNRVLRFTAILYITNILASLFMVVIAYAVAIRTYQRGWDPDNFVIPIESSLADAITTISLLVALNLTGW
jgi:mgtE-like transporter